MRIPPGVAIIEGKGKFLIPGLWDMHVHLWETDPMLNLYVAMGVLGVRDMGSDLVRTRKLRADIIAGRIPGPRIYSAGPVLDGAESRMKQAPVLKVSNPEEARQAVDTVEKASADFVKILSGLSFDEYQSIAQRARVIRMPFAGHLPDSVTALDAINARQKSMEHLFGLAIACSPLEPSLRQQRSEAIARNDGGGIQAVRKRTYETFSAGAANDLFHRMARFGVWQTPTLTLRQRMSLVGLDRLAASPELKYVPAGVRKNWVDPRKDLDGVSPERLAEYREEYEFHAKLVKFMAGTGVGMLAGTDTGDPYVVPGFALHDELAAMVDAGMSPVDALATATIGPARFFGNEGSSGTIERGRIADLVLLDADPVADIRNTRRIAAVVYHGQLLDRKCLDNLLIGKQTLCPAVSLKIAPASITKSAPTRKRNKRGR